MNDETPKNKVATIPRAANLRDRLEHPAWIAFIRFCTELEHGEIELLKIQNGLPVLAEITRRKVKFSS